MLGAFMLIRRETIDELGGFDPGYRMYGEDIDFCYRAAKAGWERWHVPAAVVDARVRGRDRQAVPDGQEPLALPRRCSASCGSTPSACSRSLSASAAPEDERACDAELPRRRDAEVIGENVSWRLDLERRITCTVTVVGAVRTLTLRFASTRPSAALCSRNGRLARILDRGERRK